MSALRRLVIATRDWPLLRGPYRLAYWTAARALAAALKLALRGRLRAVYLRRGLCAPGWRPGVSDIDTLAVVTDAPGTEEEALLRRLWRAYRAVRAAAPMLGELQVATETELEAFARWGGARARELPGWRRLLGLAALPAPAARHGALDFLSESLRAYLLLCQAYFEAARPPRRPDFGFKAAKAFLDLFRFSRADAVPMPIERSREEELEGLGRDLSPGLHRLLERPERIGREDALHLILVALEQFHRAYSGRMSPGSAFLGPRPHPAWRRLEDDALSEPDAWRRRFHALRAPGLPPSGLLFDTVFDWLVVMDGIPDMAGLRLMAGLMDEWHARDDVFRRPGLLVTRDILQAAALTPHRGSPFFAWSLGPQGVTDAAWVCRHSALPPWRLDYRLHWNLPPLRAPAEGALRPAARQTAAELSLELRLFGLDSWGGTSAYRQFYLLSRILSLALYAEEGSPRDPQILDPMIKAYGAGHEDWRPWEAGQRPPSAAFYSELPMLRRAMTAALARLEDDSLWRSQPSSAIHSEEVPPPSSTTR